MSLTSYINHKEGKDSSPVLCTHKFKSNRETSFCICQKGSLTVEAVVVIPLTAGFLLMILFFFRVLFIQAAVEEALVYVGRAVAIESTLTDTEEVLFLTAEGMLKYALIDDANIQRYVTGGVLGVSLLGSHFSGKEIVLQANYMVKFPIEFFGNKGIWLVSENHFVKWKGDLYSGNAEEVWVYVTETGSVYHKDTSCRSLDLSIQEGKLTEVSLYRGANGQTYSACNRCTEDVQENHRVYFTDYGTLYHGDLDCSALKRTISKVLLSEVGDKRGCSFCY